jgi:hypothetical protein
VAAKAFIFTLDCSRLSASVDMLRDLAAHVLGYVGCADDTIQATAEAVASAVVDVTGSGAQALGLTFRSSAGTIDIVLSSGEREVWRVSRAIP